MISKLKYILDPLDREVLDRAFDEAWAAVHAKANALIESGSDEELEALLRRELMEIASFNGLDEQIVQKILCDSGARTLSQGLELEERLLCGPEQPRPYLRFAPRTPRESAPRSPLIGGSSPSASRTEPPVPERPPLRSPYALQVLPVA